ncbi:MAG: cytochrome c oxidase subunit 3 [Pseudomonadales bacterium]|jgi:cytochrome c oxidase subunit 3|nr:cytochrome c oxidase subunit 3 [Pseudomonadales bacterium]
MASDTTYESYYVPHNSALPIFASLGIFLTVYGGGNLLNEMSSGSDSNFGITVFLMGGLVMATTLFFWFAKVIEENHAKMYSQQMNKSFVWGMSWFIFSEVMFFAAFFGALFYIRFWVVDWIGGVGERGPSDMIWPDYVPQWPLLDNPNPEQFAAPAGVIGPWGLPLVNTLLLVTSSFTVTFAHHAINHGDRKKIIGWLVATIVLGLAFLVCQAVEYYEAYAHYGLTLNSGIFGSTFFMLTGFHGAHVTIGTIMLIVMLGRAMKGHFTKTDCFGFEAAAWYWHFVDVVWLLLFVLVYIMGT